MKGLSTAISDTANYCTTVMLQSTE